MADLLEKRRSARFRNGVHLKLPTKMSSTEAGAMAGPSWRTLQWLVVCPSTPKKKRSMTMIIYFPSSVESCEGGNGLCHHFLEKRRSALLVLRGRR